MGACYDIHSWTKQYREEVLQQARMRQTGSDCELPLQPATTDSTEGGMFSGASATRARKWVVLGAVLATATAASLAFGEDPTPCYEEYWAIGLAQQQVSFDEFRKLQAGGPCAAEDPSAEAARAGPQDPRGGAQE